MWARSAIVGVVTVLAATACGGSEDAATDAAPIVIEGASSAETTTATSVVETTTADTSDGAGSADAEMTDEEAALEFAQCMRDEGLDFPDPTVDADGAVSFDIQPGGATEDLTAGFDTCSELIEGASFLPQQGDINEIEDQLLEFAECMRDEGVDLDDPDLSAGFGAAAGGGIFGPNFDPDDPANADAIDACSGILAGLAPGGN